MPQLIFYTCYFNLNRSTNTQDSYHRFRTVFGHNERFFLFLLIEKTANSENPPVRFGPEIPTVRQSDVAHVLGMRLTPAVRAEPVPGTLGRSGHGEKSQLFERLVAGDFDVDRASVRIAQCTERVYAFGVIQIVPVNGMGNSKLRPWVTAEMVRDGIV